MKIYQALAETARDITKYCFDEKRQQETQTSLDVLRKIIRYHIQDYIDAAADTLELGVHPQTIADQHVTFHFSVGGDYAQSGTVRYSPSFVHEDGFVMELWLYDGCWLEPADSEDADWFWTVWYDMLKRDTKDACETEETE